MQQLLLRTTARARWNAPDIPAGALTSSAGRFVIRADGTARFDKHHHDFGEFWFIAEGTGLITIGKREFAVQPGDILYTPAGQEHDIAAVGEPLAIFWLSEPLPDGAQPGHLHRDPADADRHLVPARTIPVGMP